MSDDHSPQLDQPPRSRIEAALEIAVKALRQIVEADMIEAGGAYRRCAQDSLDRIAILCPEKVKP